MDKKSEVATPFTILPSKGATLPGNADALAFSPDGTRLAAAERNGMRVVVSDVKTSEALLAFPLDRRLNCLAWSRDGKFIATGCAGLGADEKPIPLVLLNDSSTGKAVWRLIGHTSDVFRVTFSPDSKWLASAGADGSIRIWDTSSGKMIRLVNAHTGSARDLAFSPSGKHLVSAGDDNTIRLWDAVSGKPLALIDSKDTKIVFCVAFSPDANWLASGGSSMDHHTVNLWDMRDITKPVKLATLRKHKQPVRRVAFHPNGRYFLSGAHDGLVLFWDFTAKRLIQSLNHTGEVTDFSLTSDGGWLAVATGGDQGVVTFWNIKNINKN